MRYYETKIRGAYIVEPEPYEDEYGFFVRTWCEHEFKRKAIDLNLKQCNVFYNHKYGTLRGLHLQLPPFTEAKLVCCNRGAIYDVILDLWLGTRFPHPI
jgi:dTDP-4-dehydrorhamnose 3,5-epimerase